MSEKRYCVVSTEQAAKIELGKTRIAVVDCGGPSIQGNLLSGTSGIIVPDEIVMTYKNGWQLVRGPFECVHVGAIPVKYAEDKVKAQGYDLYVQDTERASWE